MNRIDEIQRDIACPNCQYNLRGLSGAVVNCPECGTECDIARLIARKWTGPWYHAPGLMKLTLPAALVYVAVIGRLVWAFAAAAQNSQLGFSMLTGVTDVAFYFAVIAGWTWLARRAWDVFGNRESILHVLLVHAIVLGYMAAIVGGCYFLMRILDLYLSANKPIPLWNWFALIGWVALFFVAQRTERFMGLRCIVAHLNRPFRAGVPLSAIDKARMSLRDGD
jgi:hypothetical protein